MTECMSNFKFHYAGANLDSLDLVIKLASAKHTDILGWSKKDDWLIFNWYIDEGVTPFPSKIVSSSLKSFINEWLKNNSPIGEEPDLDGSIGCGFEVIGGDGTDWSYESFRVRSIWAEYHK